MEGVYLGDTFAGSRPKFLRWSDKRGPELPQSLGELALYPAITNLMSALGLLSKKTNGGSDD